MTWNSEPLPTTFQWLNERNRSAEENEMVIKFNTANNIAKFKSQITLMKKNGLNVNPTYANDIACA